MTTIPRETHRDMILSPLKWPHMALPLKRTSKHETGYDVAVLLTAVSDPSAKFIVDKNMTLFGLPIGEVERIEYPNVDALLDDGWVVD